MAAMADHRAQRPAIEGWFTTDTDDPHLLGTRCPDCGTSFFPPASGYCRNPHCDGEDLQTVELSNEGTLWSFATNHYAPPAPYVSPDPFVPYTVAAVELTDEQMVVLGQLADDVDPATLTVGDRVRLELGTLFSDEEAEHLVWKWRPVEGRA